MVLKIVLILFLLMALNAHSHEETEAKICLNCEDSSSILNGVLNGPVCELPALNKSIVYGNDLGKGSYKITGLKNKQYLVEINPQIYATQVQGENLWHFAEKSSGAYAKMIKKINECMAMYEPHLKGPDGEILKIRAVNNDKEIRPTPIHILPPGSRQHSEGYTTDIECPTLLHEVLHLLGLVDEYKEKRKGYVIDKKTGEYIWVEAGAEVLAYDCRILGPENSVMSNQYAAIKALFPRQLTPVTECRCTGLMSSEECMGVIKESFKTRKSSKNKSEGIGGKCPDGFLQRELPPTDSAPLAKNYLDTKWPSPPVGGYGMGSAMKDVGVGMSLNPAQGVITELVKPVFFIHGKSRQELATKESLLLPAHFRKILMPHCLTKNLKYLECSQGAYKSSMNKECDSEIFKKCNQDFSWVEK